jgi:CPA2 family monovalent cation:H+ antiporter-2
MHLPALIQDLALILGVAAVVTFLFRRIKQPVVLGYIVAGIIVGPYTPAVFSVTDVGSVKVWAELGVVFLMFTLGLEFSFRRLGRVGVSAGVATMVQVVVMLVCGIVTAGLLGWSRMDGVFLGCMIAISSTTIIIKAFEELGLKTKRFAELVFGILIVEDLVAILMLVALTNIAKTSEIGGVELLLAGGKLAIVVGAWFLVGMFAVPRFVRSVVKHGNDEMLTVVAIGLCLALVAVAAYFQYSVALGAFIMGSILAESSEVKRIETLVQPLKDIFGAVFFVSVGMLLDPRTILENWGPVLVISAAILVLTPPAVAFGALITGQSVQSSVRAGFSMAQIGEFSFIIASLGLAYGVMSPRLYPIIVAVSLVTTFTTPYMTKASAPLSAWIDRRLPLPVKRQVESYIAWVQRRSVASDVRRALFRGLVVWGLNAVVVITLFVVAADQLVPFIERYIEAPYRARGLAWLAAFVLASPSIWAMLSAFRGTRSGGRGSASPRGGSLLLGRVFTVFLIGLMSIEYFPALVTLAITVGLCSVVFVVFRRQIEGYYRWIEGEFRSGFEADLGHQIADPAYARLAPWDAHLVEVAAPPRSFVVGKSLVDLQLRERYGLNIVAVIRGDQTTVAPKAEDPLYPGDRLLCFATDAEVERFRSDLEAKVEDESRPLNLDAYDLKRLRVSARSRYDGTTIRDSGIQQDFGCIVVGLERRGERIPSPKSDVGLAENDLLWVVGERGKLQRLAEAFG